MKLLVCPKGKNMEKEISLGVTSFLVGIDGYTTNQDCSFSLEELSFYQEKYPSIELFLLLNKNLFNHEIDELTQLLQKIDTMSIQGIFFYDQAILSLHQKLGLKTPLVWNQTHMVTNYNTCNYYYDQGVSFGSLAGEITLEEMLEIHSHTKMKLMATILGYPIMSHSNRKLLSHYFSFIQKEKQKKIYSLQESNQDRSYLVEEDSTGTSFYDGLLLNGTEAFCSLIEASFAYAIVFEKEIPDTKLERILPLYLTMLKESHFTKEKKEFYVSKAREILESDYSGFFFKKTIYKVKKNG